MANRRSTSLSSALRIKSQFARQRQDRESKGVMFVPRQSPVHPMLG